MGLNTLFIEYQNTFKFAPNSSEKTIKKYKRYKQFSDLENPKIAPRTGLEFLGLVLGVLGLKPVLASLRPVLAKPGISPDSGLVLV